MIEIPHTVSEVATPCLLVDIDIVKRNAQAMIDRCKDLGLQLRSQMKTHKCVEVGVIATGGSKRCIAVSTLSEAEFFADAGFDDIVYAMIFTADKIPRMKRIAMRLNLFHVLVDSIDMVKSLEEEPLGDKKWSVLIKVDCGSCRAGVLWDDDEGVDLAKQISLSSYCSFHGLYGHESQSYQAKGAVEIREIGDQATERITSLANRIREIGVPCKSVGLGATPSASCPSPLMKDLTELHPGNYLFYDVMQANIGACVVDNMAIRVATRIIGHYPLRNQMLIDCGWTALSLDGKLTNGSYCLIEDQPNLRLVKMSQEVGYVEPRRGHLQYEKYPRGMVLLLMPYHACATACMHSRYLVHSGDDIVDTWTPCRGW